MERQAVILAFAMSMSPPAFAQEAPPPAAVSHEQDERAIRRLYAEFRDAWNAHDAEAMASLWTADGDYMEPDGTRAKGREQIVALLTMEHKTVFAKAGISLAIDSVGFVTDDVALVEGGYEIVGAVDAKTGQSLGNRKGLLTAVLLRKDGRWRVALSRARIPVELGWRSAEQ